MSNKKLIRDKIAEIYNLKNTHIADDEEYLRELILKLQEEVNEFREKHDVEELADVIEVVHALSEYYKTPIDELNKIKEEKAEKKGRFKNKIIWEKDDE